MLTLPFAGGEEEDSDSVVCSGFGWWLEFKLLSVIAFACFF